MNGKPAPLEAAPPHTEQLDTESSAAPELFPRPSRSADAARARQRERLRAMTMLERMELALSLGRLTAQLERPRHASVETVHSPTVRSDPGDGE
jgi:hypothetical protein